MLYLRTERRVRARRRGRRATIPWGGRPAGGAVETCKAAVKAGDPLSPGEIEALLARREGVERSSNSPHARPTTLRLALRDLEKQFKRTGF